MIERDRAAAVSAAKRFAMERNDLIEDVLGADEQMIELLCGADHRLWQAQLSRARTKVLSACASSILFMTLTLLCLGQINSHGPSFEALLAAPGAVLTSACLSNTLIWMRSSVRELLTLRWSGKSTHSTAIVNACIANICCVGGRGVYSPGKTTLDPDGFTVGFAAFSDMAQTTLTIEQRFTKLALRSETGKNFRFILFNPADIERARAANEKLNSWINVPVH
ncbi:hypothetical protein LAC81_27125 [Ensifer adhaerens]|uniref:hypothetical protein n=1 Tax=Ensifer adhaerens TaxID=106592 RepID=UPI001CBF8D5C|nr:hypothetical protein [Ensifer adhaerens]MBZ7924403.1 hypothetical protein [Ensifer adhaerens]UAX96351.1 hypothetical protein LAC78_21360 [Ensifer adhaerens]UAY04306.1 hypothetical protein LAC80_23600 [Ensifer adhaerens]UAY12292.1 hypothetical protein LAC81_27125 [Ensifer adhaerens]